MFFSPLLYKMTVLTVSVHYGRSEASPSSPLFTPPELVGSF